MEAQLQFLAHDEKLINAWQRRDMDGLYRVASPLFQKIKQDVGVTHFYFIDTEQVCFLQVPATHPTVLRSDGRAAAIGAGPKRRIGIAR